MRFVTKLMSPICPYCDSQPGSHSTLGCVTCFQGCCTACRLNYLVAPLLPGHANRIRLGSGWGQESALLRPRCNVCLSTLPVTGYSSRKVKKLVGGEELCRIPGRPHSRREFAIRAWGKLVEAATRLYHTTPYQPATCLCRWLGPCYGISIL